MCEDCAAGRYAALPSQSSCIDCAAGQRQALVASIGCINCPAGTYQDEPMGTACKDCQAGEYANTSSVVCSICSPGQYDHDQLPATPCQVCSIGAFSSARATRCAICDAGQFDDDASPATPCVLCQSGQSQSLPGQTTCVDCSGASHHLLYSHHFCFVTDIRLAASQRAGIRTDQGKSTATSVWPATGQTALRTPTASDPGPPATSSVYRPLWSCCSNLAMAAPVSSLTAKPVARAALETAPAPLISTASGHGPSAMPVARRRTLSQPPLRDKVCSAMGPQAQWRHALRERVRALPTVASARGRRGTQTAQTRSSQSRKRPLAAEFPAQQRTTSGWRAHQARMPALLTSIALERGPSATDSA